MTYANSPFRCASSDIPATGGVAERECVDLSERMLATVKQAEARMAGAKSALRAHTRC
jgi:hypothetical protein